MSNDNELRQSATIGINDSMGDDNELGQSPTVGISDSMSNNQLGQSVSLYCFYVRTVWRQFVKSAQCQRKGQGKHAVVYFFFACLNLFLTGWTFASPNIFRSFHWTLLCFLIELTVHWTWFGHFDEQYFILNWLIMRCKLQPELVAENVIQNVG